MVPTDLVPTYELWVARRERWFQVVTGTQQYPAPDCGGVDICYRTQSLENGLTSEEGQQKKDYEDSERYEKKDLRDAGRRSRKA